MAKTTSLLRRRRLAAAALTCIVFAATFNGVGAQPASVGGAHDNTCDIRAFGAAPGDDRPDTDAFQAAVGVCGGIGGQVVVPAGRWLIGGLTLGSNMTLSFAPGAIVELIPDIAVYPEQTYRHSDGRMETVRPVFYAPDVQNLTIDGQGAVLGNGEAFWDPDFYRSGLRRPTLPRPAPLFEFVNCSNVAVRDATLRDLPGFGIRFNQCNGARVTDVTIRNDPRSPNTDGVQIRDSSNIVISGVDIATGDDAIVLKSHRRAVENVIVSDSILQSDDAAVKFGTGSAVGVRNSLFTDLIIRETRYGIALFQLDGGRHSDNRFSNIRVENGGRHERTYAIYADIDKRSSDDALGAIERHEFSGIAISGGGNILIAGAADAPVRDIVLRDISMTVPDEAPTLADGPSKPRGNITLSRGETEEDYARIDAMATLANIEGIEIDGLTIRTGNLKKKRWPVWMKNVTRARVGDVDARGQGISDELVSSDQPVAFAAERTTLQPNRSYVVEDWR